MIARCRSCSVEAPARWSVGGFSWPRDWCSGYCAPCWKLQADAIMAEAAAKRRAREEG